MFSLLGVKSLQILILFLLLCSQKELLQKLEQVSHAFVSLTAINSGLSAYNKMFSFKCYGRQAM